MLERLRRQNAHATQGLCRRLLEASGRGFWNAADDTVQRLRDAVAGIDDQIEGVGSVRKAGA
jgi:magnesium chelatase subunit H